MPPLGFLRAVLYTIAARRHTAVGTVVAPD
jgi:hypothetical protein